MLIGSRPLDRQDLTCFRGISSVVPAHFVIVTPQALASRRYWDFDTTRQLRFSTFEDYVDAFHELFVDAVKRRTRSAYPVAISVSGGLDSSSVFCQAETLRRVPGSSIPRPRCRLSYVSDRHETDEQHFLATSKREFGVHIDRFPIEPLTGLVRGAEEQVCGHRSAVRRLHVGRHARAATMRGRGSRRALDAVGPLGRSDAVLDARI